MSVYETLYKILTALPLPSGELQPFVKQTIQKTRSLNRQILLAYPPKVGGTFMRSALITLLSGHYDAYLSRGAYANTDQSRDLHFPTILNQHIVQSSPPRAAIMHLHMYPSRHVTEMIDVFDIPVIITTRDILDTLLSGINMADGMEKSGEAIDDTLVSNGKPYLEMTAEERRYSVVNNVSLWYARFYAQWLRYDQACREQGKRPPLWLRYDELIHEPEDVLARMARHVDPQYTYKAGQIKAALEKTFVNKAALRFNKGVSGRGHAYFSETEKQTIYGILENVDGPRMRELGIVPGAAVALQRDFITA